jgi:phenylacetate-coenzyme A ligase PaaK-like adenylate-forming protein
MNGRLLSIYHHMPGWTRSVAATIHGYRLRRRRYGSDLESLTRAALERDWWSAAEWDQWREERLRPILSRAAAMAPHYRSWWEDRRPSAGVKHLGQWPVLEKDTVRTQPASFVCEGADRRYLYPTHTSGTTGKPLHLWLSRDSVRAWYALSEARWRRWYGVSLKDRWAILGGQLIAPAASRKPPFWVWNAGLRQLYLSSYHLGPDMLPHYFDALRRYRVQFLYGYSSSLYAMARAAIELGRSDLELKVVISNAEPLLGYQRETIARAFRCPVRETYGTSENVAAASECESGRLHLWPDAGVAEVLRDGRIAGDGSGELLATGLLNAEMPLIRYRIGDFVTLGNQGHCACGRTLPVLESVEGRTDDLLVTADGRLVGRLDPVFKGNMALQEAQIIQEDISHLRVRYVPAVGFSVQTRDAILYEIQARMGPVGVSFEQVERIPRGANGKFRAVISNVRPSRVAAAGEK